MDDFYALVESAIGNDNVPEFLSNWHADPNITLEIDPRVVTVAEEAVAKTHSGFDSLEWIYSRSKCLKREIAFSSIIDIDHLHVTHFLKGRIGSYGFCDWEHGDLLDRCAETKGTVALGHTHPQNYGAICSDVYWQEHELRGMGNDIGPRMHATELYDKYGGDYLEMFVRSSDEGFSNFFWILSPREGQAGLFRIEEEGMVVYHPWEIR